MIKAWSSSYFESGSVEIGWFGREVVVWKKCELAAIYLHDFIIYHRLLFLVLIEK